MLWSSINLSSSNKRVKQYCSQACHSITDLFCILFGMSSKRNAHYHICGDVSTVMETFKLDAITGCGHIYRHTHSKDHICPKCGRPVTRHIPPKEHIEEYKKHKKIYIMESLINY